MCYKDPLLLGEITDPLSFTVSLMILCIAFVILYFRWTFTSGSPNDIAEMDKEVVKILEGIARANIEERKKSYCLFLFRHCPIWYSYENVMKMEVEIEIFQVVDLKDFTCLVL